MMLEIENHALVVTINTLGAELHSLRSKTNGEEYLWSGDEAVWSGRAPILFPIVGALRHASVRFDDETVSLAKHGFARNSEFQLLSQRPDETTLLLSGNEPLDAYPWPFQLSVNFKIVERCLKVSYRIHNTGQQRMPFNIGSHPAFALDLEKYSHKDYFIEFSSNDELELYAVTQQGLLATNPSPYSLKDGRIQLSSTLFNHDALVFKNIRSREIRLGNSHDGIRLSIDTGSAPHLGLWAKPGSAFVCIEPWWGHADFDNATDNMAEKPSLQILAADEVFNTAIAITV